MGQEKCWLPWCSCWSNVNHHIFYGDDRDDRFQAAICGGFSRLSECHGVDDKGAHGVNAKQIQIVLAREWVKRNPDRKSEILRFRPFLREYIK